MSLTYVEASVLTAWALDSDQQHSRAERIIQEIEAGQIDAITSTLAVMEVIDAIRKRVTERSEYIGSPTNPQTDMSPVKDEIERVITEFLDGLSALACQDKVIWTDPDSQMNQTLQKAMEILQDTFGPFDQVFKDNRTCYIYRGVGQYDVQHALIAQLFGANCLLTFDRGFSKFSIHPHFAGITFSMR